MITNNILEGLGTNLHILGQIVAVSTNISECLINVTDYLRAGTNADVSFLVSQGPRWNVTLPSLDPGDTQPGGIRIVSMEGATPAIPGPRLRLVYDSSAWPQPITSIDLTPDRSVLLGLSGAPETTYSVQASTNIVLTNWITLGAGTADTNGWWSLTDFGASNYPHRFYRSTLPE